MSSFTFTTCSETEDFCRAIAKKMRDLFGMSEEEANGRINQQWAGQDLGDPEDVIFHEDEEYWAKTIYYGKDSFWWKDEAAAKPKPFP